MSRSLTSNEKGVDLTEKEKEEHYKNRAMQIMLEQAYQDAFKAAMQTLQDEQGKVYEALSIKRV